MKRGDAISGKCAACGDRGIVFPVCNAGPRNGTHNFCATCAGVTIVESLPMTGSLNGFLDELKTAKPAKRGEK